jgi:hypothetical protein
MLPVFVTVAATKIGNPGAPEFSHCADTLRPGAQGMMV